MLGADKLNELEHEWQFIPEISSEFGIVCLSRNGDDCGRMIREDPYLQNLSGGIRVLESPAELKGISSTEVRRRIREIRRLEEELKRLVPEEIRPLL